MQRPHLAEPAREARRSLQGGPGFIDVASVKQISLSDITPALARKSGFAGVVDLLKIARNGPGENVYLVEFTYSAT